jgi:hypothetical protein
MIKVPIGGARESYVGNLAVLHILLVLPEDYLYDYKPLLSESTQQAL